MPRRPHIVVLLADQLSARALPAYGNDVVRAPAIERLGEEAVVFERALCASPLCVPSRASLMSGLLPSATGAYDNAGELPATMPTFAHHLRAAGYRTVLVGKMHFIGPDQLHGFEERPVPDIYPAGLDWIPDWRLGDDETLPWYHDLSSVLRAGPVRSTLQVRYDKEVVREARRVIADTGRDPSRPLLLVVSFTHPHDPYEVPPAYWDRYDGAEIDPPADPEPPDPADPPTRRLRAMVAAERIPVAPEQVLLARHGYYGAISLVDDHIASILETLRESGLANDTIVVFSSDHGDMLGERGLWYKMAPFEDSIRVPLFVHAPRRFAPHRVARPVSLLDVLPTLVELAGGSHDDPAGMVDGVSFAGALEGDAAPIRDVPLEYLGEGVRRPQVTLVRGRLKLVLELGEVPLLYDVEADPAERTSRLGDPSLNDEEYSLMEAATARWDLEQVERDVLVSQHRRRLVARALASGEPVLWDHPSSDPEGPYIRTGQDFWDRLESERLA